MLSPTTPVSKSTLPSRSGLLSLSSFWINRSRTPGAFEPTASMISGPKFSTNPSLVRSVNIRESFLRSGSAVGRRTACASRTSSETRSRSSRARGVATRPRPALTSSGSPVVSRSRASERLIAEGLSRSLRAAAATLPSDSTASRVMSRLRSGFDMLGLYRRSVRIWRQTQ